MHLAPVDSISIRQGRNRRVFSEEHLATLAESIASDIGLLQLPVVRQHSDGRLELLAGERRLRAMQLLWAANRQFHYMRQPIPIGQFPHALINELDELAARAIELDENIQRVDLSWQERVTAIAELHALRKAQNPEQTARDTAVEIGYSGGGVIREAEIVARHLNDPQVATAPTVKDAMKRLRRKLELEFRAGAVLEAADSAPPLESKHTLRMGDMTELMLQLPTGSFDIILTDPPYGVNAETFRAKMTTMHEYDDDWDSVEHLILVLASEGIRVTKPTAHAYVFCDLLMFSSLQDIFEEAGWDVWPRPLIWVKDVGHIPNANLGPQRRYECILFANKGNKPVQALYPDVAIVPAVNNKFHAAEKPVDLLVNLLRRSVIAGDRVLDPFCGSGSVFEAAEKCQCLATGFELDAANVQYAQERLKTL